MKQFFIFILLVLSVNAFSQNDDEFKTIFGGREVGGYGSFSIGYTTIDTSDAMIFNARGGIILGHVLTLGLGGSGFISEYQYDSKFNYKGSVSGGYGGMFVELIIAGNSPVHLSVPCLFGIGGAGYSTWTNEGTDYERINFIEDIATFLVIEPGIELEFNMTKYFRIAGYFNYRYTSDIDLTAVGSSGGTVSLVNPDALNSYSAGLIFKFGKF